MSEISGTRYLTGSGEPLLLLHGFTGTWQLWRPILADLAARFEVLAPTLPGHDGGPTIALDGPFNRGFLAQWAEQELDRIGADKAHVVGNSMGGALALELAKRGRARSVVTLASGFDWLPGDPVGPRLAKHFRRQLARTRSSEANLERVMRLAWLRRCVLRTSMVHGDRLPPDVAVAMARATINCTIAEAGIDAVESGGAAVRDLNLVEAPTLIAWPGSDRLIPHTQHGDRFGQEIPNVTVRVLPQVGHLPMYDDPTLVTSTIVDWINQAS
jgi:pimeloyl-ACP methyl ester carboxylesterase